jgi:hypothetical protein
VTRLPPILLLAALAFAPLRASGVSPEDRTVVEFWDKWTGAEGEAMQAVVDDFNPRGPIRNDPLLQLANLPPRYFHHRIEPDAIIECSGQLKGRSGRIVPQRHREKSTRYVASGIRSNLVQRLRHPLRPSPAGPWASHR